MNTGDLLNHLRMRLTTMGLIPPIDPILITYLNNAYTLFVKEMGGVSDELQVVLAAGATEFTIPDYVLKLKAVTIPDQEPPTILNRADARALEFENMYGKTGEITYLLIGTKKGVGKVAYSPVAETTMTFDIDRLPTVELTTTSSSVDDVHHLYQLDLLHLAVAQVLSHSVDAKLRAQAADFERAGYIKAREAKDQKAREQSKTVREVAYGGI